MAEEGFNLFTIKRAARQEAWHGPGNKWNLFAKTTWRSSSFPAPVRDDDSVSGREPKVIDAVTKPRIERIEMEECGESILQDTNDFNHNNSKLQNVEELYWDPMGELSNSGAGELSVSANFSVNIRTESREEVLPIDMHVLEFGPSGKLFKVILKDTEGLSEYIKQTSLEPQLLRLYFLQDVSIHASPIVSRLLDCSVDVFRDHFKRASDYVAFLLPSRSYIQDHVVIPYQRCYRRSSAKSIREIQNKRSTFCHGNLASSEEHVTVWTQLAISDCHTALIICDDYPKQCYNRFDVSQAMRSKIENKLQELIHQNTSEYPYERRNWYYAKQKVLEIALRIASYEWQAVIRDMLKMNLRVIDSLKERVLSEWRCEVMKDYQFLENKVMIQMKQNSASIPLLTAMIAVEESRKAIQQANDVKALTVLATVYIPLSFVAGVFGMNLAELNSGVDVDIWLYFAISIPVTIASMVLVWKWEWLIRKVKSFRIRPNNSSSPRTTVSGALFSVGKMTAGIGKPRGVQIGHDLEK
ncbi:hypothetical protein BPAE_0057g00050 [Botrytis paeoniae]|uniref:Uncharacterized protein n=1 Tax=Botrytis paeoniae TaxID=278948 RepID=A0A4Z1FUD2_9HELO|nr:hypothetical protein BPAE_0057g00050 [Botrytis paeoniae]